jgi:NUMOD4 motif/HNH endonuclease
METWKNIPNWEDRYEVSDKGRVRSKNMQVGTKKLGVFATRKGRMLELTPKSGRYLCVTLAQKNCREQWFVHDLVLLVFKGPKPKGLEALHINDNKTDNSIFNLRYGTKEENENDRQKNGRVPKGEKHGSARLTNADIKAIRASNMPGAEIARKFGVGLPHIWAIRARRVWKHL